MTAVIRADALRLPLRDESVDLIVTSPPYFALRSYEDGGEHYDGQIGSEPTPQAFLEALWAVTAECRRVLKPHGSMFVNLGDKYAGSGGHNNAGISSKSTLRGNGHSGGVGKAGPQKIKATRRSAPDAYNKATIGGARPKSLMGLPWRYANGCVDQLDLILRAEIIWHKRNCLPESVGDRVRRNHEQWFHFSKEPQYFAAMDNIREEYSPDAHDPGEKAWGDNSYPTWGLKGSQSLTNSAGTRTRPNPLGKLPGSVWPMSGEPLQVPDYFVEDGEGWRVMDAAPLWRWVRNRTEAGDWSPVRVDAIDHYAAFPQEWPRRFILAWCPPDGVVLDPFGGTGTTAMVARALGRTGVSVDLSSDYCRLARWRIFDSGHASKSRERTNQEAQMSIFGGAA